MRFCAVTLVAALFILLKPAGVTEKGQIMKKPIYKKWWFWVIVVIFVIGILPEEESAVGNDTTTTTTQSCAHEYTVIEQIEATCSAQGKIIEKCSRCGDQQTTYKDMLAHQWDTKQLAEPTCTENGKLEKKCSVCGYTEVETTNKKPHEWVNGETVQATCTIEGYTNVQCKNCLFTNKVDIAAALGHELKEILRVQPTFDVEGKIQYKCVRCNYQETEIIPKKERVSIEFDNLKFEFGDYSFVKISNQYSEYYGKNIVKLAVTITNLSNSAHSLNYFYSKIFGVEGTESPDLTFYFDDSVGQAGDLLPGKSYTKYFYFIYDGNGTYIILFDDMWFEQKTVEIEIVK